MNSSVIIIIGTTAFFLLAAIVVILMISHQRKIWKEQNKLQQFKLEQQKKLMKAVIETQEKERERIAQDLHDEIGALAISLKVNNDAIRDFDNGSEKLIAIREKNERLANEIIRTGRQVSHDLLPPIIRKCGLIEALKVLAEDLSSASSTVIDFESNSSHVEMDIIAEISIYRVIKEWIHNVMKHANASRVRISVWQNGNNMSIHTEDNGKGFNFDEVKEKSQGLGLMNIEGRLNHLNANFRFERSKDKGTLFVIEYSLS